MKKIKFLSMLVFFASITHYVNAKISFSKEKSIFSVGNNYESSNTYFAVVGSPPVTTGELKRWHKISLTFDGPNTSELANPNPFSNFDLKITFTHSDGTKYTIPGYFAACGNAEDNGCKSGNKWRVNFTPDRTGSWNWTASFKTGTNVAINGGGTSAGFMDGDSGNFNITESDKAGKDFRNKNLGRLKYVGEHYLKHIGTNPANPNGPWFVKSGADSPENAFNYVDFDATPSYNNNLNKIGSKTWQPHQRDYVASDASNYTWGNSKGTEILGMLNYLSGEGANVMSFLTWNTGGDGGAVFPHILKVSEQEYGNTGKGQQWNKVYHDRFDVSKMAQWENVMEYADKKGIYLHFKTMETENDNKMDGNNFGRERKLYYRELIARFSHHLALNWNLTEETTLTDNVAKATASYIKNIDPYDHNIVIHTYPDQQDQRYNPLLGNRSDLTGASIQTNRSKVHNDVKRWVEKSKNSGKKWIVANDEQGSATVGIRVSDKEVRYRVLWGTLLAGGAGVEYYSGYTNDDGDINGNDHRKRGEKYKEGGYALRFFNNYLQKHMTSMVSSDGVTNDGNDYVFAKAGEIYAVYRPNGGSTGLNLPTGNNNYNVQWYNPRLGGDLSNKNDLGQNLVAPDNNDWVALITKKGSTTTPPVNPTPPITGNCNKLYEEINGIVAVEAEDFSSQTRTDKREWVIHSNNTSGNSTLVDPDPVHTNGSSGDKYIELLPDTRVTHGDPLIGGTNFSNEPGVAGILNYRVYFNSPGKYFVWVRAYSTGSEDNGIHVGLNGSWPNSGKRMQWCSGKNNWTWESKQRTGANHCGQERLIYLNIPTAGEHTINFSMREDGFEFDKFILSKAYSKPQGKGAPVKKKDCTTPPPVVTPSPTPTPTPPTAECNVELSALSNFTNLNINGFSPAYVDNVRQALAINASVHKNKFAAAQTVFNGDSGSYNIRLNTLTEIDGESTYRLVINGQPIGSYQNPSSDTDYEAAGKTFNDIVVTKGATVRVEFNSNTNGKIPEGASTAFSRGRWTSLNFTCTSNPPVVTPTPEPTPTPPTNPVPNPTPPTNEIFNIPGIVEAENFNSKKGSVRIEKNANLGYIKNGDYVEYNLNVVTPGKYDLIASLSSAGKGGRILIYIDGKLSGNMFVPVNGKWFEYYSKTERLRGNLAPGIKKVKLVFTGSANDYLFNIEKLNFKIDELSLKLNLGSDEDSKIEIYPNPSSDIVTIKNDSSLIGSQILIYDLGGVLQLKTENNGFTKIDISNLAKGVYLVHIMGEFKNKVFKLIKD